MSIAVIAPGLLTTVQDTGRRGHAAFGVGVAGAMDAVALRLANALVGNDDDAAALELTVRGPRLRFDADSLIALAGAEFEPHCSGRPVPLWRPVLIRAGAELDCGAARRGARGYLALAGGIDAAPVLGSRSTDVNAGIGPHAPLHGGDVLHVGEAKWSSATLRLRSRDASRASGDTPPPFAAATWSIDPAPWFDGATTAPVALIGGAHLHRLDAASREVLFAAEFRVAADSNRVACRLDGPALRLAEAAELISEGVVPGTVQLPPGGKPIVLLVEAPTTGGYPRIGHVPGAGLARLAQCRPGARLRFAESSVDEAQTRYLERERALQVLVRSIRERLGVR